jgi:antibiotic biosynthesis monooxygenase (ABM) superfamily enzyme
LAETKFGGFRGTEIFHPVEGIQDEWTALYRYDNATDLDKWLISEERQDLLAEGKKFSDFSSRTIDNSFGSWFAFDEKGQAVTPPSDFKSSMAVWVGVYPTVVLITLALSPLHWPLWLGLLVGNLLSSFALGYLTMPYLVNPLLKNWLWPPSGKSVVKSNWQGFALVAGVITSLAVFFYLITRVFWHLP